MNPTQLSVGDSLSLYFDLVSKSDRIQNLVVDYAVHHIKANGMSSPKVFKLKNVKLGIGEKLRIKKRHSFRKVTTRKYYPGRHVIEILINGKQRAQQDFILRIS